MGGMDAADGWACRGEMLLSDGEAKASSYRRPGRSTRRERQAEIVPGIRKMETEKTERAGIRQVILRRTDHGHIIRSRQAVSQDRCLPVGSRDDRGDLNIHRT